MHTGALVLRFLFHLQLHSEQEYYERALAPASLDGSGGELWWVTLYQSPLDACFI
jgi:hypothetical protein